MTYPASTKILKDALDTIDGVALRIKTQVQTLRAASAVGDTNRTSYLTLHRLLNNAVEQWDAAVAGVDNADLIAYAIAQKGDPTLEIVVEYTAMKAAALSLRNWIYANVPTHAGTGAPLVTGWNADGTTPSLTFTVAQTVDFRTEADSFTATIV